MNKTFYVYIIANASRVLYIGMTNNVHKRFWVHREKLCKGFTSNFHLCRLVYYESFDDVRNAINREKQLKRWRREKKVALIEGLNRDWRDLSEGWYSESKVQGVATRLAKSARLG